MPTFGGYQNNEETEVCCSETITKCLIKGSKIWNILFFQFIGMVMFTYSVIIYSGLTTFPGIWVVQVGMFFSLVIAGSFGCGHLNPALTVALAVRKQNRVPIPILLLYWTVQYGAAFVGTFLAWSYGIELTAPFPLAHPTNQAVIVTLCRTFFGSGLFLFAVLIIASSDTTFTKNNGQVWFCVPLSLITVCKMFNLVLGTNPAQALAFQVVYYMFATSETEQLKHYQLTKIWAVLVGTTVGGFFAGILFQFVYRPYAKVAREQMIIVEGNLSELDQSMLTRSKNETQKTKRRTTDIEML